MSYASESVSNDRTPEEARSSMTTIPNFRAQGMIIRDHDLGAAMSRSLPAERGLPRLYRSELHRVAEGPRRFPREAFRRR